MEAINRTVVISGYYGYKNSGDEAVLKSILHSLALESAKTGVKLEPVVLSIDPEWTARMYGVRAVPRMQMGKVKEAIQASDGLISGGGSLLQDVTGWKTIPYYLGIMKLAQWLKKPVFIYSQGIGPVSNQVFYPLIRHCFQRAKYVSVRDQASVELLAKMGVAKEHIQLVADPVMSMPLPSKVEELVNDATHSAVKPMKRVGISVRPWETSKSDLAAIENALHLLMAARNDVELCFLPFHAPGDVEASRHIMDGLEQQFGVERLVLMESFEHPQHMLAEVAACDVLLGMRLHSLIYAASQEVPLLGISYDPKIDQFLERLEIRAVGSTSSLQPEELARQTLELLEEPVQWKKTKSPLIRELKEQSRIPAQQIVSYLRQKK